MQGQHSSPTVPPNTATSQPTLFTNPFPQQGFVATQPPHAPVTTQPSPSGSSNYQILMMASNQPLTIDLNLQTRSRQYSTPLVLPAFESPSSGPTKPLSTPNGPLQIPPPKAEVHTKIPKGPLRRNATSSRATHSYSIVDDMAQSPAAISTLEIL